MISLLISIFALLFGLMAAVALAYQTGREARRVWGWPIPGIRVQVPGTNGRWKLDWGVVLVFWMMAIRDGWTGLIILKTHPILSPTIVLCYLGTALAKTLVLYLLLHDQRHLKEKTDA